MRPAGRMGRPENGGVSETRRVNCFRRFTCYEGRGKMYE
jgi:hypothetical protein